MLVAFNKRRYETTLMASRMLVTHALPYANGSLHLGHMVESVQTDVFVRAMNAMGTECIFICADDTHGTPIEISARKAGVAPEEWIARIQREHAEDYKAFELGFDLFYTTHSPENEQHTRRIYEALRADGAIEKRDVEQVYCSVDKRFLPDRYIRGECPVCGTKDQYGDSCENCGSTYEPTDLKNPRCAICGNTNLERRSWPHYFVKLSKYQEWLRGWTGSEGRLQPEIRNVRDYLDAGLDPEWLRYFYAANLGPTPSDIDLSLQELKNRVNGELLANVGNLANRALSLIWKNGGRLTRSADVLEKARTIEREIAALYERCDTRAVVQKVLEFSSAANQRLQAQKPWEKLKSDRDGALAELTLAVNVARLCARWLAPIVPRFAKGVEEQSGAELRWGEFAPLEHSAVLEPAPLVRKVEDADIQKLSSRFVVPPSPPAKAAVTPELSIEQFGQMDLRAGKVLSAERVPKKDKLLKLSIDLGEAVPRTIVSGVAQSYEPQELVGKILCVVANLPPRDFGKGLVSHGMVLYASGGDREHTAIELPGEVKPGSRVK